MAEKVVCVTGASGLVASWLVKRLLERGYHVRGTGRNPDKASDLWELDGARERLELLQADLSTEGAFDSIVEGCQGVFHVATPTIFEPKDPEKEVIEPAVLGTLNLLKSCKKSSTVKRVVFTSSAFTIVNQDTADKIVDESTWGSAEEYLQQKLWYAASKVRAEQAALDFAKSNDLGLATVITGFVIGPVLGNEPKTSVRAALQILKGDSNMLNLMPHAPYVHLDDVATAHILVYENPKANGRYICAFQDATNVELVEFLSKRYPEYKHKISKEFQPSKRLYKGINHKKLEDLGLEYKSMEQMFDECVLSLKQKGFL